MAHTMWVMYMFLPEVDPRRLISGYGCTSTHSVGMAPTADLYQNINMQSILILPPMSGSFELGAQDVAMRAAISAYKTAMHKARCEPTVTGPIISTAHLPGEMRTNTLVKTLLRSGYTRLGRCRIGPGKLTAIYVHAEDVHLYTGPTAAYRKLMACEKN